METTGSEAAVPGGAYSFGFGTPRVCVSGAIPRLCMTFFFPKKHFKRKIFHYVISQNHVSLYSASPDITLGFVSSGWGPFACR